MSSILFSPNRTDFPKTSASCYGKHIPRSNIKESIVQIKNERAKLAKHIQIKELPEDQRFDRRGTERKHLVETIKLVAYRAETALSDKEIIAGMAGRLFKSGVYFAVSGQGGERTIRKIAVMH